MDINLYLNLLDPILLTIGLWFLLPKCGIEKLWSLVPYYKKYLISECADQEEAGRTYMFLTIANTVLAIVQGFIPEGEAGKAAVLLAIIQQSIVVALFIYRIRIYSALCTMFSRRKGWVVLWVLFESLTAVIWGLSKSFQPRYKTTDTNEEKAAALSGIRSKATTNGLAIDIDVRMDKSLFKSKCILRDIHMNIEPGRMVLLLGGSGAGKTTFVNAITGYEKAKATISLNGRDVYKEFDAMKYDIGFVPQQDLIRYNDTVKDTVYDCAKLRLPKEVKKKELEEKVEGALEIFGLEAVKDNIIAKQSGGQKKRTSISTEFMSDPSLFILDEPDSGLDGVLARDLMQRLHDISRSGKIVIVITHSPDRVIDLFDEVIILAKDAQKTGRLVFKGPVDEAREFFGRQRMEDIIKMINTKDEGGEGMADELIEKFTEVCNAEN